MAGESSLEALREKRSYANYLFADGDISSMGLQRKIKVAFLRNYTVEMLLPIVRGEAALCGAEAECCTSSYDDAMQQVLDRSSGIYDLEPDVVCVCLSLRALSPKVTERFHSLDAAALRSELDRVSSYVEQLISAITSLRQCSIIWQNFWLDRMQSAGILDAQFDASERETVHELNARVRSIVRRAGGYVLDTDAIISRLGHASCIDDKAWHVSKTPFTREGLVAVGQEFGRFLRVMLGDVKKCLVMDCDNTLWGGVVGEDGTHCVKIGSDYPGSVYRDVQQEALDLKDRGIILAICSKNEEADVLDVFRHNREMLLSIDDIAAYEINWRPKSENIASLARRLNIGLDSMVFVDDSEFECGEVKRALPMVDVICLSGDPSSHARTIRECGLFNAIRLTIDDRLRSESYRAETVREEMRASASTVEEYLKSLDMRAEILVSSEAAIARAAQLTQKTNQFNLTTIRYTDADIRVFCESPTSDVLTVRVTDRVADMGIVGVMILRYDGEDANIDTFLMSCRALGRGVEDALFAAGMENALLHGCRRLTGRFVPTAKNAQVKDLYGRLGMTFREHSDEQGDIWERATTHVAAPSHIKTDIIREG